LEELGFEAFPGKLTASAVGAPHKRERVFILADAGREPSNLQQREAGAESAGSNRELAISPLRGLGELRQPSGSDGLVDGGDGGMGDADEPRADAQPAASGSRGAVGKSGGSLANPGDRLIPLTGRGPEGGDGAGSAGASLFPPGPKDDDAWVRLLSRAYYLRPSISQEEIESDLCNCPDELAALVVSQRTDALRAAGNGVVALQGAVAFKVLARRAGLI
jgi:DNA (cytosine-5)-methyltransferase 1